MNITGPITSFWEKWMAHQSFKKYLANTSWLFLEKGVRLVAGFVVGVLVARHLGPEQFGQLSYVQSFVVLLASVATLGLDDIVIRELVKNPERRDLLLGTTFFLKIVGTILLFGVLGLANRLTSNDAFTAMLIFLLASGIVFQIFNVIEFYFRAKVLSRFSVFANIISLSVFSLLQIVLVFKKAGVLAFISAFVVQNCILAWGYLYFYRKQGLSIWTWSFDKSLAKKLLKDSWPLILSGLVIMIHMRIDQVMIKKMLGIQNVGFYAVAVMLSEAWYFIPIIVSNSLFPAIISGKERGPVVYYERLEGLFFLLSWTALIIILPVTFFSGPIIHFFYGENFAPAAGVLSIHIWNVLFVFLGVAKGRYMMAENIQWLSSIYSSLGAVLNIWLNYLLIPSMGIQGAAWAALITQIMTAAVLPMFHATDRKSVIIFLKSFFEWGAVKRLFTGNRLQTHLEKEPFNAN